MKKWRKCFVKQYKNLENKPEDEHVLHLWTPLSFEAKRGYHFLPKGIAFSVFSAILYGIAFPLVSLYNKVMYQCKVVGKENLEKVKGAKITISNHMHPMDCTMAAMVQAPKQVYFPTLEENFRIPVINGIIKLLHAIPIPQTIGAKMEFYQALEELIQENKTIHMYPEGSLWPYYPKLRNLKLGAFQLAVKYQIPIVPIVYKLVSPTGMWEWKSKPCIEIHILEPEYPRSVIPSQKEEAIRLRDIIKEKMEDVLKDEAETRKEEDILMEILEEGEEKDEGRVY